MEFSVTKVREPTAERRPEDTQNGYPAPPPLYPMVVKSLSWGERASSTNIKEMRKKRDFFSDHNADLATGCSYCSY